MFHHLVMPVPPLAEAVQLISFVLLDLWKSFTCNTRIYELANMSTPRPLPHWQTSSTFDVLARLSVMSKNSVDFHSNNLSHPNNNYIVGGWTTQLKNMSQLGSFPQIGVKIKHILNHHLDNINSIIQNIIKHLFFEVPHLERTPGNPQL